MSIVQLRDSYGLDGVDLDVEDSAADAETQIMVIQELRDALGEDFEITYTYPCLAEQFEPWAQVIQEAHPILDGLNVMAYDAYWEDYTFDMDLALLDGMGVPRVCTVRE